MDNDKYNGWSNYETWNVALFILNTEGWTNYWCEKVPGEHGLKQIDWVPFVRHWFKEAYTGDGVTPDGVSLTDDKVNWDEIYENVKSDWKED